MMIAACHNHERTFLALKATLWMAALAWFMLSAEAIAQTRNKYEVFQMADFAIECDDGALQIRQGSYQQELRVYLNLQERARCTITGIFHMVSQTLRTAGVPFGISTRDVDGWMRQGSLQTSNPLGGRPIPLGDPNGPGSVAAWRLPDDQQGRQAIRYGYRINLGYLFGGLRDGPITGKFRLWSRNPDRDIYTSPWVNISMAGPAQRGTLPYGRDDLVIFDAMSPVTYAASCRPQDVAQGSGTNYVIPLDISGDCKMEIRFRLKDTYNFNEWREFAGYYTSNFLIHSAGRQRVFAVKHSECPADLDTNQPDQPCVIADAGSRKVSLYGSVNQLFRNNEISARIITTDGRGKWHTPNISIRKQ